MTAQELVTKSLESYTKGQAIIIAADTKAGGAGKGVLSTEEHTEVNKWFSEADGYKLQADTMKKSEELSAFHKAPLHTHPMGELGEEAERKELEAKALSLGLSIARPTRQLTTFLKSADPRFKYPLRASSVEAKAAQEAYLRFGALRMDEAERKALSPLTGEEGGFLVVDEFRAEVIRKLRNLVFMRERCTVINTQSAQVSFPTLDIADTQTGIPLAQPNAAVAQASLSSLLGKTSFTPHKRAVLVTVPMELIEDAVIDVFAMLTDWFSMRSAEIQEQDFLIGTGVNMPVGLVSAKNMPTLAIAGATTAIVPEDIVKNVYGMRAVYRKDAAFMMHRLVIQAIRLMRTNIGGAGTGTFMFQPSMQAGEPPTLFGYPLLESEFFPNPYSGTYAVAGAPMILFGNLKYYWIVDRIDMQVQRLNELYAANDQIGFRMRVRYDGAPVLADPFLFLTRN